MPDLINKFRSQFWEKLEPQNATWSLSALIQLQIEWPQINVSPEVKSVTLSFHRSNNYNGDNVQFEEKRFSKDEPLEFRLQLNDLDKFHANFEEDTLAKKYSDVLLGYIIVSFQVHKIEYAHSLVRIPPADDRFSLIWGIASPCARAINHQNTQHKPNRQYQEWRIDRQPILETYDSSSVLNRLMASIQNQNGKDLLWLYGPPGCGKSLLIYGWQSISSTKPFRPVVIDLHSEDDCPLWDTEILRHKFTEAFTGQPVNPDFINSDLFNRQLSDLVDRAWAIGEEKQTTILVLDGFDHCLSEDSKHNQIIYRNLDLLLATIRRDFYGQKVKLLVTDILPWEDRTKNLESGYSNKPVYRQLLDKNQIVSLEFPMWHKSDIHRLIQLLNPAMLSNTHLLNRIFTLSGGHLSLVKALLHNTKELYSRTSVSPTIAVKIPESIMTDMSDIYQVRGYISPPNNELLKQLFAVGMGLQIENIRQDLRQFLPELRKKKLVKLKRNKYLAIWRG